MDQHGQVLLLLLIEKGPVSLLQAQAQTDQELLLLLPQVLLPSQVVRRGQLVPLLLLLWVLQQLLLV
jgi:hypothetical protein